MCHSNSVCVCLYDIRCLFDSDSNLNIAGGELDLRKVIETVTSTERYKTLLLMVSSKVSRCPVSD